MTKSPFNKIIISSIFLLAFAALGWGRAEAQVPDFGFGSIVPFKSLQTFFGPLFPPNGIGDTFRSEFGMGMSTPMFDRIKLKGTDTTNNPVSLNLLNSNATTPPDPTATAGWEPIIMTQSLDGGPIIYDFFAKFRAWRFAGKIDYMIFDSHSRRADGSGFFFDSVVLSGDVDIIQGPWLTAGGRLQFFLNQPYFKFNNLNFYYGGKYRPNGQIDQQPTQGKLIDQVYFSGSAPWTIGAYIRYVPPEILGFPMHFDAYADFPLKGSPLQTYGVAFVFRPQIYRFDLFTRLKLERSTFSISADVSTSNPTNPTTSWSLDMLWNLYGAEFGIYF
ncbi:MAG: hypothetical protein M1511_14175 [Deltaproteobacteria bacterium]|nr:hypothetical protein [Deltaproteobacteria bacterium]